MYNECGDYMINKNKKNNNIYDSEILKHDFDSEKIINRRLIILMGVLLALFFLIAIRLYYVQIVNKNKYENLLEIYSTRFEEVTTPRGQMFDINGQLVVANTQVLNISYIPPLDMTDSDEWVLAYDFQSDFLVDYSNITSRDKKDLLLKIVTSSFIKFILDNDIDELREYTDPKYQIYVDSLVSEEEWENYSAGILDDNDIYQIKLANIDTDILNEFSPELLKTYAVKINMDKATSGASKLIKSNVSKEETAYLMEHNSKFPGMDVQIDWERDYPYGNSLQSVLGSVTTSTQGLPLELKDYYLALGYSLNSRVGKSGLEEEYEDLLSGEKAIYKIDYSDNEASLIEVETGARGNDLQLSIDIKMQSFIESKIIDKFEEFKDVPYREYMNRINVVVTNPTNGDVKALVSVYKNADGEYISDPIATYTNAYPVGSVVKGATVYMGLDQGLITADEKILDTPFKIKATPAKSSWKNLGYVDAKSALAESSNVYMYNLAVRLGGGYYYYDGPLYIKNNTFQILRNYYASFGLGELTGLDVPNEMIGYMGSATNAGNVLDFVIGQYDNYTTMMLAQYISTIANGGDKLKLRLVTKAYNSQTSEVVYENPVTIINSLGNAEAISTVREGMYDCVNASYGICSGINAAYKNQVAGKSGTAQDYIYEKNEAGITEKIQVPNNSFVSFAPYDNPSMAIACIVPQSWSGNSFQTNPCYSIADAIYGEFLFDSN